MQRMCYIFCFVQASMAFYQRVRRQDSVFGEVKTYGGTGNGSSCTFPFLFQGQTYTKCITSNHDRPWCSVTEEFSNGLWGNCIPFGVERTYGGNSDNASCVLPFTYQGRVYTSCTSEDHDQLWCSTSPIFEETQKWGNCLPHSKVVTCYVASWSIYRPGNGKFDPSVIDPLLCTHIILAFADLVDGQLKVLDPRSDTSPENDFYGHVTNFASSFGHLKTLLAVGGWSLASKPFTEMVATNETRARFIKQSVLFLRQHGFNGLDVDWEYPGARGSPPSDKEKFTYLLQELRQAFEEEANNTKRERLLLTAAVSATSSTIQRAYQVDEISKSLDYLNIMAYDFHGSWDPRTGHHSPLFARSEQMNAESLFNQASTVDNFMDQGAPASKLVLGMGTYGRSFTLSSTTSNGLGAHAIGAGLPGNITTQAGVLAYYEICDSIRAANYQLRWDAEHRVPYAFSGDQWVGFDNPKSVAIKSEYVISEGLGGAMIWSVDMDDFGGKFCGGSKFPLLSTINKVFEGRWNSEQLKEQDLDPGMS